MKRCPQCLFLYPETDERCDFDQTPLEVVDESEIDAVTASANTTRKRSRVLPIAAAVTLILGVLLLAIYFGFNRRIQKTAAASQTSNSVAVPVPSQPVAAQPSLPAAPSPSPSPSPSPKTAATGISSSHTRATSDPVSTSGPGIGTRQGGKPVIMTTSGGKIEADEVWRTRDGVWYRRNGMVTLLKRGNVKAIVTR
jgi:cytoskeletal protein RodZ